MIPIQLLDDIMAKKDEQHVSGELSRVEEAGTEDTTSTLTDGRTSTSNDGRTSTSTDGTTSTSTDDTTSISTDGTNDGTTSTSIDGTTSMSIDSTTSTSTNGTTSTLIDDIVDRHPSLEELPRYIVELEPVEEIVHNADSKHLRQLICAEEAVGFQKRVKRIHDTVKIVIPCAVVEVEFPIPPDRFDKSPAEAASIDTDRIPSNDINNQASIDATTSPSIDTGRVSEHKEFDVCGNLRGGDTTTRSEKSRGKKRKGIKGDSQLSFIPRFSDDNIDLHPHSFIDRHTSEIVDQHPSLEELPGYIVELEPVEERVHESEASRNADSKHLRPLICAEEAAGFQKRVKRIHDPVKFVVPCAVVEVEFPIPPDKGAHLSSYVEVLDDHQHVDASQRGLRFRDEVDKDPAEATSIDTNRIPSNNTKKPTSIDATTSPSIDTGRISEQKKFDVYGNLRDEDTTTRSDKSGKEEEELEEEKKDQG
ncbi:hypothetical protein F2Q68_00039547 [Brassica cretica]|uniref:Uncharacterized protein n=1 Tax=Brassica cretica TaxID=69181 RepID=A0A8S9MJL1_BRACR|nr:hypothetical protein F2Q68_00039547 [Brassica cretica]